MNHHYRLLLILMPGLLLASCVSQGTSSIRPQLTPLNGSQSTPKVLLWSDEFTGTAGELPDPSKWVFGTGGSGWGNRQLQYDTTNATQNGQGHLVINALQAGRQFHCWYGPCEYTSARITTIRRESFTYGELSAELTIPIGQGIWSAFWIVGANCARIGFPACGEIDIAESKGDGTVIGSLHSTGLNSYSAYGAFAGAPHRYTLRWTASQLALLVDGQVYFTATRAQLGSTWAFDHPFNIILDIAVGGTWPGSPDDTTIFPAQMVVSDLRLLSI